MKSKDQISGDEASDAEGNLIFCVLFLEPLWAGPSFKFPVLIYISVILQGGIFRIMD